MTRITKKVTQRKDQTIPTVAFVITSANIVNHYDSWIDDEEGNNRAEKEFKQAMLDHGWTGLDSEKPLEACLDDGYVELGDYTLQIVHS